MHTRSLRLTAAALAAAAALALGGCTTFVSESCSGSDYEVTCSVSYKSSEGTWSTELDGPRRHSEIVIGGTFTVESGSGTLAFVGPEESMEYELSADEPVEVTDLTLTMYEPGVSAEDRDSYVKMRTESAAEGTLEGFSGEYTYVTR